MAQKKGLLDFSLTTLACITVYTQTPVGALAGL